MIYEKVADAFKDSAFKFRVEEFVHPAHIKAVGLEKCIWYISLFQVNYAALLRQTLNAPVIINTYHVKKPGPGYYVGRGTRPRSYKPNGGAELSQHYYALALDVSSSAYAPHLIFKAIIQNEAKFKEIGLTTLESLDVTPGWVHGDARQIVPGVHPENGFLIVKP